MDFGGGPKLLNLKSSQAMNLMISSLPAKRQKDMYTLLLCHGGVIELWVWGYAALFGKSLGPVATPEAGPDTGDPKGPKTRKGRTRRTRKRKQNPMPIREVPGCKWLWHSWV